MKYLYIFEDGSVRQSANPPSEEDLQSVDDGYLTIITLDNDTFVELDGEGSRIPIKEVE